jgi:uncharacterized membrane protein
MASIAVVSVKSAWTSKINWVQLVSVAAVLGTVFGIDISAEDQAKIVAAVAIVSNIVTGVIKTWFTPTITPQSIPDRVSVPPPPPVVP